MSAIKWCTGTRVDLRSIFQCDWCGASQAGGAFREVFSDMQAADESMKVAPNNRHMPSGWASYGEGIHHCPACVEKGCMNWHQGIKG